MDTSLHQDKIRNKNGSGVASYVSKKHLIENMVLVSE